VRIISGSHRGRKIIAPNSLPVRPTTDMAKESLFNILHNKLDLDGLDVLDLFAGIGSISFEFASRGAGSVTAVDINYSCIKFISDTADKLDLNQIKTLKGNVFKILRRLNGSYDIIFADPPYDLDGIEDIPDLVYQNNLLKKGGILIIEHPSGIDFSLQSGFEQHRKYSRVNFSFF